MKEKVIKSNNSLYEVQFVSAGDGAGQIQPINQTNQRRDGAGQNNKIGKNNPDVLEWSPRSPTWAPKMVLDTNQVPDL